jgi:hypothetical protein
MGIEKIDDKIYNIKKRNREQIEKLQEVIEDLMDDCRFKKLRTATIALKKLIQCDALLIDRKKIE